MGKDRQPDKRSPQRFMTNLVDKVKSCIPELRFAKRCRKNNCSVKLNGVPAPHVLIDVDKSLADKNITKCDYIFVGGTTNAWLVPIELKKGDFRASEVVAQLQAGAQFAETLSDCPHVRFLPVLASGASHKAQRNELKKKSNWIEFRGRPVEVEPIRCGGPLAWVLK